MWGEMLEVKGGKRVVKMRVFWGWFIMGYVKLLLDKLFKSMRRKVGIKEEWGMKNGDFGLYIVFLCIRKSIRIRL